jgi:4-amino-4-deoxy-L-arabinose transferase-like glycosyltransferase
MNPMSLDERLPTTKDNSQISPGSPPPNRLSPPIFWITLVLLLSAALRFHALGQDVRFHPDEALYTTFARSAVVYGDWMLPGVLDKPPLSIYLSATAIHFLGTYHITGNVYGVESRQGEFAARFPNVLASLLLTALVYALAKRICRETTGPRTTQGVPILAAFLVTCSPYVIVFSATAFTDMLMLVCMVAALLLAARGQAAWSGVFLALSIASKPQGVFYLPLVLGLMAIGPGLSRQRLVRLGLALGTGMALLLYWDAARPETSVFVLGRDHYTVEHLIVPLDDWLPRLSEWLGYGGWLLGPPVLTAILLGTAIYREIGALREKRWQRIDWLLWGFIIVYGLLHWIGGLSVYDRYLLPLVPLLAIVVARGIALKPINHTVRNRGWTRYVPTVVAGMAGVVLVVTAFVASDWRIDLGRDHYPLDRDGEIIQLADYLNAKPVATIIYNPWLGWEMGYYLGVWSDKRQVHYPDPVTLVADALRVPETAPRYLIAPRPAPVAPWLAALEAAGFRVTEDYKTPMYISYRLLPPPIEDGDA